MLLCFTTQGPNRDVDVVLYVLMGVLSFPTSVVVVIIAAGFLAGLNALTGAVLNVGRREIAFIWCVFLVAGTFQWFAVVPGCTASGTWSRK